MENGKFVLSFNYAEGWYTTKNKPAKNFEVAGADGAFVPAAVKIAGAQLFVGSDKVTDPKKLRFMWDQSCEGNLYNEACLLPSAFHIDVK